MRVLSVIRSGKVNGVVTFNVALLREFVNHGHKAFIRFLEPPDEKVVAMCVENEIKIVSVYNNYSLIIHNQQKERSVHDFSSMHYFIIHNLDQELDMPEDGHTYDQIFSMSERGIEYMASKFIDAKLIRNGIDLKRFQSCEPSEEVTKVLILDLRNNSFYRDAVIEACGTLPNLFVRCVTTASKDIEQDIREADVVFAYGRCAIEAMAMGKQVVVYGTNGGDGLVTSDNFDTMAETNFSGWSIRTMPPPDKVHSLDFANQLTKVSKQSIQDIKNVQKKVIANYSIERTFHTIHNLFNDHNRNKMDN